MAKPPKKPKENPFAHLDDLDNTGVIGGVEIPIERLPASSSNTSTPADPENTNDSDASAKLDIASAKETRAAMRNMQPPSDAMRSAMDRLRDLEGVDEFDADEVNDTDDTDEFGIQPEVNYENLPAVVSRAVALPDQEKIKWHKVKNLPGFQSRGIRNLGRNEFDYFTKTPQEDVVTVAYLKPPGNDPIDPMSTQRNPNTPGEVLKVIKWLQSNAKDLGRPDVPEIRTPIPGYQTQLRHFTANGIRFHVMMDSINGNDIGYYVYAWPEKDSKHPSNGENLIASDKPTKQLRENKNMFDKNRFKQILRESQIEEMKYSQFINKLVKDFMLSEARSSHQSVIEVRGVEARARRRREENASLTRLIGDKPGGRKLIRNLHAKHKLSDTAIYVDHDMNQRILWKLFKSHPDNFQIIIAKGGVAGIKPFEKDIQRGKERKGNEYNPATDNTLRYQIVAFRGEEQIDPNLLRVPTLPGEQPEERDVDPTVMQARGGVPSRADLRAPNIFDRLREQIGTLQRIAITTGAVEKDKIEQRAELKKEKSLTYSEARIQVLDKLRGHTSKNPVLLKLVRRIRAEMDQTRRRTNDIQLAKKLLNQVEKLDNIATELNTSGALPSSYTSPLFKIFDTAVLKTLGTNYVSDQRTIDFLKSILSNESERYLRLRDLLSNIKDELQKLN